MTFAHPELIHLLWLAIAIVGLLGWLDLRGGDALGRFISRTMQLRLAQRPSLAVRVARLCLVLAALVLGVLGLMRPQARVATQTISNTKASADILVALDVSKSMLAEDAAPNRLARAKAELSALVDRLDGHRIGLVAFAGRATLVCPLTADYDFFRIALRDVDSTTVTRGGTRLGDAIRKGVAAFGASGSDSQPKMLIVITDGEDHDSYPTEAAKAAQNAGIRIVTIGFGSESGSEITVTDPKTGARSPLKDNSGNIVNSKLDGTLLREIALETEGAYVPAGVAALDLDAIVRSHITPIVRETTTETVRVVPTELYRWFVLGALFALVTSLWLGSAPRQRAT